MNESTFIQLKTIVERAVRPVRASNSRKREMREELLAHVSNVFDEEMSRLHEEATALEQTARRFGNPADVTSQLQESMPASDTVNYHLERLFAPPGESVWRCAVRHASIAVIGSALIFATAWSMTAQPGEITLGAVLHLGAILASVFLLVLELYFLVEWMRRAVYEPARPIWLAWFVGAIALFCLSGHDSCADGFVCQ